MRFVSIDIETTGLDPDRCEILEVGATINDPAALLEELPTFRFRFLREVYQGEPFALSMHRDLFLDLSRTPRNTHLHPGENAPRDWYGWPSEFNRKFSGWLQSWGIDARNFVAAGKNFANFDARFLRRLIEPERVKWHHRILDPGNMYMLPTDEQVPGTATCCQRAGIYPDNIPGEEHTAVHDALVVAALIRKKLGTRN
jgi:DNA polymerase III epsilon subunit-like protein